MTLNLEPTHEIVEEVAPMAPDHVPVAQLTHPVSDFTPGMLDQDPAGQSTQLVDRGPQNRRHV
jgi:hypothetical protein